MPTNKKDLQNITKLGNKAAKAERALEVFPNHAPGKMTITLNCKEFTCLCPVTHQPDYAQIEIIYIPDKLIVESKSMKLYLETYRNAAVFHEHVAIDIAQDIIKYIKPLAVQVIVHFNIRGGIAISADYHWENKE